MPGVSGIRERIEAAVAAKLSPEGIRKPMLSERLTVCRLPWVWLVRLNRWLAAAGKVATGIWCAFVASIVLGFDWERYVRDALNSGRPLEGAFVLTILLPTLIFLVARSGIGYCRWRLQRELWRRDVDRLGG